MVLRVVEEKQQQGSKQNLAVLLVSVRAGAPSLSDQLAKIASALALTLLSGENPQPAVRAVWQPIQTIFQ